MRGAWVLGLALLVQSPALNQREMAIIRYWLVCTDCGATRDSVRAIGLRDSVALVDTLTNALNRGPAPGRVAALDSVLNLTYPRDSTYRLAHGLTPFSVTRNQFRSAETTRYVNGYRSRAALGLGTVHTAQALNALDNALLQPGLAAGLRHALIFARDSMP